MQIYHALPADTSSQMKHDMYESVDKALQIQTRLKQFDTELNKEKK